MTTMQIVGAVGKIGPTRLEDFGRAGHPAVYDHAKGKFTPEFMTAARLYVMQSGLRLIPAKDGCYIYGSTKDSILKLMAKIGPVLVMATSPGGWDIEMKGNPIPVWTPAVGAWVLKLPQSACEKAAFLGWSSGSPVGAPPAQTVYKKPLRDVAGGDMFGHNSVGRAIGGKKPYHLIGPGSGGAYFLTGRTKDVYEVAQAYASKLGVKLPSVMQHNASGWWLVRLPPSVAVYIRSLVGKANNVRGGRSVGLDLGSILGGDDGGGDSSSPPDPGSADTGISACGPNEHWEWLPPGCVPDPAGPGPADQACSEDLIAPSGTHVDKTICQIVCDDPAGTWDGSHCVFSCEKGFHIENGTCVPDKTGGGGGGGGIVIKQGGPPAPDKTGPTTPAGGMLANASDTALYIGGAVAVALAVGVAAYISKHRKKGSGSKHAIQKHH